MKIINKERSLVIACDFEYERLPEFVDTISNINVVGGLKFGAGSGRKGWENWVNEARKYTNKVIIYDHEKAGTNTPHTAKAFMRDVKASGFDAVIIYPLAGFSTAEAYIDSAFEESLGVIVGGRMTHNSFLLRHRGYISDESSYTIYRRAMDQGVNNFAVPGNQLSVLSKVKKMAIHKRVENPVYFPIGIGSQGGNLGDVNTVIRGSMHPIIGRDIIDASDSVKAIHDFASQL